MGYQKDRERFYLEAERIGLSEYTAGKLLRYASTLQRLAVAQCNGDWPADNGERRTAACTQCEGLWVPSVLKGAPKRCPDCRTADLVRALLAEDPRKPEQQWEPRFEGDPHAYVLRLVPRGTSDEDYQSGRVRPIYVPGRER